LRTKGIEERLSFFSDIGDNNKNKRDVPNVLHPKIRRTELDNAL